MPDSTATADKGSPPYLKESGAVTLLANKGGRVIADNHGVFDGVDDAFRDWCADEPSEATHATDVTILEVTQNARPSILFGSLIRKPDQAAGLALTQDQILDFSSVHRARLCFRGSTNFLFVSHGELLLARVQLSDSRSLPYAYAYRFSAVHPLFDKKNVLVVRHAGVTSRILQSKPSLK